MPDTNPLPEVPKVSFCTTCMGRLPHMERTFLKNIADNQDYPNTEFVLLNYGSDSALEEWARHHLKDWIACGKVHYYRTEHYPFYHSAHAKNVAHKLASGDILCNLDADNFTGRNFAGYLVKMLREKQRRIAHGHWSIRRGTTGRVALLKTYFWEFGGYLETLKGWGGDDLDMIERLTKAGFDDLIISDIEFLQTLDHGDSERVQFFPPGLRAAKQTESWNRKQTAELISSGQLIANSGRRWGKARVYKNFAEVATEI